MALTGSDAAHVKDVLKYFFASPPPPNNLTDDLADIAAKCLATAVEMSKAMDRAIEKLLSSFPNSMIATPR